MLTIDEFIQLFPEGNSDYIHRLTKPGNRHARVVKTGFIRWDDAEAHKWAGPWDGNHVLFTIIDHSKSGFGPYPLKSQEELLKIATNSAKNAWYNYPKHLLDKFAYSYRNDVPEGTQKIMISHMNPEEFNKFEMKINESIMEYMSPEPSIERPIRIHMVGTDDCSYSVSVATDEFAFEIIDYVENFPCMETLKMYNFVFTN